MDIKYYSPIIASTSGAYGQGTYGSNAYSTQGSKTNSSTNSSTSNTKTYTTQPNKRISPSPKNNSNTGLWVAIVVTVIALAIITWIVARIWRRKNNNHNNPNDDSSNIVSPN